MTLNTKPFTLLCFQLYSWLLNQRRIFYNNHAHFSVGSLDSIEIRIILPLSHIDNYLYFNIFIIFPIKEGAYTQSSKT